MSDARDFYASAEGVALPPKRCLRLLRQHHIDDEHETEFFEEFGFRAAYDAQQVLAWLGY